MNFELLTPHQLSEYREFLDTILICGDSGAPLDIASPHAGSRLVSQQLASKALERYRGRTTLLDVGAGLWPGYDISYWAEFAQSVAVHDVRYGILIADRLYVRDKTVTTVASSGAKFFVFDWYQWLRQHIPPKRLIDSFLYICMASDLYRNSPERNNMGVSDVDARAMAKEGLRILEVMASDLISGVSDLWEHDLAPND